MDRPEYILNEINKGIKMGMDSISNLCYICLPCNICLYKQYSPLKVYIYCLLMYTLRGLSYM